MITMGHPLARVIDINFFLKSKYINFHQLHWSCQSLVPTAYTAHSTNASDLDPTMNKLHPESHSDTLDAVWKTIRP